MDEFVRAQSLTDAAVIRRMLFEERANAQGTYVFECFDRKGRLKWCDTIRNLVVTQGKNFMLDTTLSGSGYSVSGPYLGLISAIGYSAITATDTMASHPGWLEAGLANDPKSSNARALAAFAPASAGAKALATFYAFNITSTGTLKGAFLALGGATPTPDNTSGVLWSAGTFISGDKGVGSGDVLNVNYSTSL